LNYMAAMNSSSVAIQAALHDVITEMGGFLGQVEKRLEEVLQGQAGLDSSKSDTLISAARHLCIGGGGKRARPLLVRLFGNAVDTAASPLLEVAIASELIHSASLLHDDVVDAGMFRRGRPTVNARWGNTVAVMAGDLLLSTALGNLACVDAKVTQLAIGLVAEMTRAAIAEVEARGDLSLPVEKLRVIAEGKTGALFGFCGRAAAKLAGDDEAARRFDAFGRRLGVAFQMADDIRDLTGADEGKPQYADIQSRTPSLPILLAMESDDGLRRRLKEAWAFSAMTPDRVRELGQAISGSGAVPRAVAQVSQEVEDAVEALGPYASKRGGDALVDWARRLAQSVRGDS
jgi:heptaprenyl diphosphate synthase